MDIYICHSFFFILSLSSELIFFLIVVVVFFRLLVSFLVCTFLRIVFAFIVMWFKWQQKAFDQLEIRNNGRVIAVVCSCAILWIFLTSDTFFCFVHIAINCVCWWNMVGFSVFFYAIICVFVSVAVFSARYNENACKIHNVNKIAK